MMAVAATVHTLSKTILILVAMEVEERAILGKRSWTEVTIGTRLGITAKVHKNGENSVSVIRTGVGTTNAAVAVALFAEKYPVTEIMLLGVGGSIVPQLKPGETVLATSVEQHDCFMSDDSGQEPMAPGELYLSVPAHDRKPTSMPTDKPTSERLRQYLSPAPKRGIILSGNEFVGSRKKKVELAKAYPDALLVEMESAGVAQMARKMKIPFAIAKTVADVASPKEKIGDHYLSWIDVSARTAEQVILGVLREIGE